MVALLTTQILKHEIDTALTGTIWRITILFSQILLLLIVPSFYLRRFYNENASFYAANPDNRLHPRNTLSLAKKKSQRAYLEKARLAGSGPFRLNQPLALRGDMYAVLFASQILPGAHQAIELKNEEERQILRRVID